ncbi:MAG: hypothetical protein AAF572_27365 [Cyanobacteria bacterium P01_B01_bin.77]
MLAGNGTVALPVGMEAETSEAELKLLDAYLFKASVHANALSCFREYIFGESL